MAAVKTDLNNVAQVDGYTITARKGGTLSIRTPEGRYISVLWRGTHVVLRRLPPPVRKVAEGLWGK